MSVPGRRNRKTTIAAIDLAGSAAGDAAHVAIAQAEAQPEIPAAAACANGSVGSGGGRGDGGQGIAGAVAGGEAVAAHGLIAGTAGRRGGRANRQRAAIGASLTPGRVGDIAAIGGAGAAQLSAINGVRRLRREESHEGESECHGNGNEEDAHCHTSERFLADPSHHSGRERFCRGPQLQPGVAALQRVKPSRCRKTKRDARSCGAGAG